MSALIEFDNVCKYYQMGDTTVKAADHISMKINKGEFVAIVGQSGSGKSTCMNIIGCLDVPTAGTYRLNGRDVGKMNKNERAEIRNEMLGFIFQPDDPLGLHRNGVVVGDEHHGVPLPVQLLQHPQHLAAGVAVQRAGGLISQNDRRAVSYTHLTLPTKPTV